jgi:hypothetical protein
MIKRNIATVSVTLILPTSSSFIWRCYNWRKPIEYKVEIDMGLRFQKRIRIFKGLTINLSKTGASLSVGGRGATVNFSKRGTKTTVGLPGSGISYSTLHKDSGEQASIPHIAPLPLHISNAIETSPKPSTFLSSRFFWFFLALIVGVIVGRFI